MTDIALSKSSSLSLHRLMADTQTWCNRHQAEIGVAEMAVGSMLITWGVQNGLIEMGTELVATALSDQGLVNGVAAAAAGAMGTLPGVILGSIGIAAGGTAIGIPAAIVIGGGAFILGSMGYTISDLAAEILTPSLIEMLKVSAVAAVGTAMLIDGARRMVTDKRVLATAAWLGDHVLHLNALGVRVVASTYDELKAIMDTMFSKPESPEDLAGSTTGAAGGAMAGAAAGSAIGAGAVTVLGSKALGAAALSLGLVSAPVWPIVVGGIAGLGVGYAAWKAARHFTAKHRR